MSTNILHLACILGARADILDEPITPEEIPVRTLVSVLAFCAMLHPMGWSQQTWAHTWGGTVNDLLAAVATDGSGNAYFVGNTSSFGAGGTDVLVLKYDSAGNLIWSRTWGGPGNETGNGMAVDSSGNVYVAGGTSSFGAGSYDVFLLKFDTSGNLLWSRTWGGTSFDQGYDAAFDNSGNIYVAAESYSLGECAVLLKFDPSGNLLSTRTWKGTATYDATYSLNVDTTGNVVLTGVSWDYSVSPNHNSILILKFDSQGNFLWHRDLVSGAEDEAGGNKMVQFDAGGNIFVAGHQASVCQSSNFFNCNFIAELAKLDPNGNLLWDKSWGGAGYYATGGATVDQNGNLVATGTTNEFVGGTNAALLLNFDTSGNLLQSSIWGGNGAIVGGGSTLDNGAILITGSAPSAAGSWQTVAAPVGTLTPTLGTFVGTIGESSFTPSTPSGTVTAPTGVIDTGGGGANALAISTLLQSLVTGTIKVTIGLASATFAISGPANYSGTGTTATFNGAPTGTYTVTFGSVPGYATPAPETQSLSSGGTISFAGTYQPTFVGANGTPSNPTLSTSEPINTATGNYYTSHADLIVPGKGLAFNFTRFYNALDPYSGPIGVGWTHSFNIFLTVNGPNVTVKEADGHQSAFVGTGGGAYDAVTVGVFDTLQQNADATFTLTRTNQTRLNFSAIGQLTSVVDRNGNTQTLLYGASGTLATIIDSSGRTFTFATDANGRITSVSDPLGRSVQYAYDTNGNLASVRDTAGGVTQYFYDANHRMTSASDARGVTYLQNTFDSQGRVITQTNARNFTTTLAYGSPGAGTTTFTDPLGNATQHVYDSSLRIVKVIDAKGGVVSYSYDANNDRTSVTNQDGKTTAFAYDANGNTTTITDPLGDVTTFAYDIKNDLLTATNPKGNTTNFSYDVNGNLLTIKDALGDTTTFAYGAGGLLSSKTDARGNTTAFSYDALGDLTKITDALGDSTTLAYDGISRLTSVTDAKGHSATSTYDALSHITAITDALGNETQFAYDPVSNLLKITDANGHATSYAYDGTNDLTMVTDAAGNVTRYAYDANDNRVGFTNAKNNTTAYGFDQLNRLNRIDDALSLVTSYGYDAVGNVTSTTDANGKTNQFSYDPLNRLINIAYADGTNVSYSYDSDGNRLTMTDPHGTTDYLYDSLDRTTSVTEPVSKVVQYSYDALGNRSSITYSDGKKATYAYDRLNRLTGATDWLGKTTSYSYDAVSNLVSTQYPNRASIGYTYDAANRLTQVVNSALGLPLLNLIYTLDKVGNRTSLTTDGIPTQFTYDPLNELLSAQLGPLKTTWTYDPVGNRMKQVAPTGTTAYTYDADDRLLTAGSSTFTYDANGNRLSETTGASIQHFSYDAANRLTQVTGPGLNSDFAYDGDGNRVAQTVKADTYAYVNDINTSLPVVLSEQGPDGAIDYAYGMGLIEEYSASFNYFYHYDGLGSVIALTDVHGIPAAAYAYDPWGNALLTVSDTVGTRNKFRFTGEALDPGTGLYYLHARYYDPITGRFPTRDPLGLAGILSTGNQYQYSLNNPTDKIDKSGLFSTDASLGNTYDAISTLLGWSSLASSYNNASQQATQFNQCTLNLEAAGCQNIGQLQMQLNKSIATLNTQATQEGVNVTVGVTFSPSTYGLSASPIELTASTLVMELVNAALKAPGNVLEQIKQAFAIPIAKASVVEK